MSDENEITTDFNVRKFYAYTGPNNYLDRKAMVFNIYIAPEGPVVDFYKDRVLAKLPQLATDFPNRVIELFAKSLSIINKMNLNLFCEKYSISRDNDEWVIAIEFFDENVVKNTINFVSEWFIAMNENNDKFDFDTNFATIQQEFNKTIFGGPTLYSLVEAGVKKGIPVHFLFEENQLQWGYGKKQQRGRSTIFNSDSIKDIEFTQYKDMVAELLETCGFPTPLAVNCFTEEEITEESKSIGFPCVIKPITSHKGVTVSTGINSVEQAVAAFNNLIKTSEDEGVTFEGALIQEQIDGDDYRLLLIGGKFAAAIKREPATVTGDGTNTISQLIDVENKNEMRSDAPRSPLTKIRIDDSMIQYLALQNKTTDYVPAQNEIVRLRSVANISTGGISINVTDTVHPKNIELAENIARFFNINVLSIDVITKDISQPWAAKDFGIIELNAGPGIFMHLAPAVGQSIDLASKIMEHFFGTDASKSRIPIIAGNNISDALMTQLYNKLQELKPNVQVASVNKDGIKFDNQFFTKTKGHDSDIAIAMRDPKLEFAIFNHTKENIYDFGVWHSGSDVAILDHASYAEYIMKRDLLPDGLLIEIDDHYVDESEPKNKQDAISDRLADLKKDQIVEIVSNLKTDEISDLIAALRNEIQELKLGKTEPNKKLVTEIVVSKSGEQLQSITLKDGDDLNNILFGMIEPYLKDLLVKYE